MLLRDCMHDSVDLRPHLCRLHTLKGTWTASLCTATFTFPPKSQYWSWMRSLTVRIFTSCTYVEDTASFKTTYGSKERSDVNYSQIFLAVNAFLMLAEKTVGSRRIVMFSMEDNPAACVDDGVPVIKSVDDVIRKNFKDMLNNGRRIDLYGINRTSSRQFNNELFYKNFMESVQTDADEENNTFTVYSESTSSQVLMRHRFLAKRSLASMKFTIVPDQLVIGIRMYSLVQEATKPKTEYATQDTLDTVKNKTEWRADNEEQTQVHVSKASQKAAEGRTERIQQTQAQKGELKYFFTYGGEKAVFSAEELAQAKSLFEPGLALLGFKPVHYLLPYHNITHSYFIYPDEASVLGSVTAFTALLQSLANLNQIAICRMQARKASTPRLVALCPQTEVRDNKGVQLKPPGLNVVVLPYADDIRSVPHTPTPTADPELVKHMTNIAMGMKEDFTCSIRNPRLHRYYDMLEATALEYEEMPETPDLTLPNPEKFALFDSDFEAIDSSYPDVEGEKPTIHRKKVIATADEDEEEAPKKKKKSARSRADESGDDSEEEPVKKKRKPASSEGIDVKDFWRKVKRGRCESYL